MDYAEEQRQRWNAGRAANTTGALAASRAPTGLEQHTAALFTGANVSATVEKFLGLCSKLCSDRVGSRRIGRRRTEWRSRILTGNREFWRVP
jgi:hypothetical protein